MNFVDSGGWLEYFSDKKNAGFFAKAIENVEDLIVSPINVYEVFKVISRERDEEPAFEAVAAMEQGNVIPVDTEISLSAAKISLDYKIPMADSIILATARLNDATLWTQDSHFKGIEGVKYIAGR